MRIIRSSPSSFPHAWSWSPMHDANSSPRGDHPPSCYSKRDKRMVHACLVSKKEKKGYFSHTIRLKLWKTWCLTPFFKLSTCVEGLIYLLFPLDAFQITQWGRQKEAISGHAPLPCQAPSPLAILPSWIGLPFVPCSLAWASLSSLYLGFLL